MLEQQMTISYKHANGRSTINQKLTWKTNQKTEGNANTWRLRDSKEGDFFPPQKSKFTHPQPKPATTVAGSWSLWGQTDPAGSECLSVLGMCEEFPTFPRITPTAAHLRVVQTLSAIWWAVGIKDIYQHNRELSAADSVL